MTAAIGSLASGRMDLVTVLRHEVGHLLGMDHGDGDETQLMGKTLEAGIRLSESAAARVTVEERSSLHALYASSNLFSDRWSRSSMWSGNEGEPTKPTRTIWSGVSNHDLVPVNEAWWIEAHNRLD